jgi:BASS family bile acid:Na+ symporter
MVAAGLILGIVTGGFTVYGREIAQVALVVAMTFSLGEISFARISPRAELRGVVVAFAMSYVVLTGLLLAFALLSTGPIRDGWVLTAAVPPAVAVVPIISLLKGDTRRALIALAVQYVAALALVPAITLAFVGQSVPLETLAIQTVLLIGVPILLSRPLRAWPRSAELRPTAVGLSFLVLVTAIVGSTRSALFGNPEVLATLSALSALRTFGVGAAVLLVVRSIGATRDTQVAATSFVSFKNLGLAVVLAFSPFFEAQAALPPIVSLVFEILWLGALPMILGGAQAPARPGSQEQRREG